MQGDDTAYDRLIMNTTPIDNNNVTTNYNFFYNVISSLTNKQLKCFYDAIMKLAIVNVSLKPQEGDDPQLIFESLNSTGKALEESDKIRNFILMNLSAKDQEEIYKKYWEPLEKLVTRNDIDTFIRFYLAIKTRELINKSKLYFAFKAYMQNKNSEINNVLAEMIRYAKYYAEIRNATDKTYESKMYQHILARLMKLEMNTSIPLLFDLFAARDDGELTIDEFKRALEIIESYVGRREICNLPTNALNKIFVSLGKLSLNKYVKQCNSWGEAEIVKRASLLYDKAQKVWWMPSPVYKPKTEEEWVCWDDELDFTWEKIIGMKIFGDEVATDNISDAYKKINITLFSLDPAGYSDFGNRYHNGNAEIFIKPYEIGHDMYIETNLSSQSKIEVIREWFNHFEFNSSDLQFLVKHKDKKGNFDINDESTFDKITVGQLAVELLSALIESKKITEEEIEKLKTTEYTRQTFDKIVYPYLADSKDANKYGSNKVRYRKEPITFGDKKIFVSSQWFDYSRDSLIVWYKKHF